MYGKSSGNKQRCTKSRGYIQHEYIFWSRLGWTSAPKMGSQWVCVSLQKQLREETNTRSYNATYYLVSEHIRGGGIKS